MERNRTLTTHRVLRQTLPVGTRTGRLWLAPVAAVSLLLCGAAVADQRHPAFAKADGAATALETTSQPAHYETASSNGSADLTVVAECSETRPRAADVTFRWTMPRGAAEAARLDLTMFARGFANGDYLTSGVLDATTEREIFFAEADPGIYYYWRLLTRGPDGWAVAANGRFEAPVCPFDSAIE
jgi:hypothetical protein